MSLSRLELAGFKSFMNPITLEFKKGVTSILGPNGCGKTNIVDAVRWVLGEQSARQLRSNKMENVIFNGTEVHKPVGQATVSMTVSNERGVFPLDYSEITITRKVYRSGISEYFINKNPCRLKDIKNLFADTGTGSHSYAVIEQEMMDYVLNDAHGERKEMFEEAAGIVKYRMRRDEAKRKLKLTEQDLLRLDDILEELGKQVRSLRYQVGKTKRYKRLKDKIRDWELILLRKKLSGFMAQKRDEEKKLGEVQETAGVDRVSNDEMEIKLEDLRLRLVELEKSNSALQNKRYELRKEIQSIEEKIIQLSERRGETERRIERSGSEIDEANKRIGNIKGRIESVLSESESVMNQISGEKSKIEELEGEYAAIFEKSESMRSRLMSLKQTQLDFIQDRAKMNNEIEHNETVLAGMDEQIREAREGVLRLEADNGRLKEEREGLEGEVASIKEKLRENRERRGVFAGERAEIERELPGVENDISENKEALASNISRLEMYRKMMEEFEGFPAGARYLLKKGSDHIRGPVAELLNVEKDYSAALEAVLGGVLDGIVVDDYSGVVELIEDLKRSGKGRARFLVESTSLGDSGAWRSTTGCIGKLSSFIGIKLDEKDLIRNLFDRILVFEDTERAVEYITSRPDEPFDAVSVSGVYLCRNGEVHFYGREENELPMLDRKGQIDKLEKEINGLNGVIGSLREKRDELRENSEIIKKRIERLERDSGELDDALSHKSDELREKERECIMAKEKHSLIFDSLVKLEDTRKETLSHLEEVRLSLQMRQGGEELELIEELESGLAGLTSRKEELEGIINERKVSIASLKGSFEKREEEAKGLREMREQFEEIVRQRTGEIGDSKIIIKSTIEEINQEREMVRELLEKERGYQGEIDLQNDAIEEKREEISELESILKERKKARENLVERENVIKISISSLETKMNDLIDMAKDLYNEDYQCYLEGIEIPLSEDEEIVTSEMLLGEKDKLERLGPVNLAAIEEYEEKKDRFEFLTGQKEDLVKAEEELREAIIKINRKARKLFKETFELVSGYFSETFRVLFEGGEATLSLTESTDPLEAKIDISARPKGKKLQDISLLSGGERALTSLALLFALYKAKPSPFCILDEVDAPLDDSNIKRFVRMVRKFSEDTQFIVITHNKGTMEMADSLLGVTMQEKGVSTVVSVDLEKVDEILKKPKDSSENLEETAISQN